MKPLLSIMNSRSLPALLAAFALAQPLRAAPAQPAPPATRVAPAAPARPGPTTPAAAVASAPAGSGFRVTTAFPKYVTADIEFRDPSGAKWPTFFYGRPANTTGVIQTDAAKPQAAFVLLCDKLVQSAGDQSRKVLGELCPPGQTPTVSLDIQSMSPLQAPAASGKGKPGPSTATLQGVLEISGRKVPVKMATTFQEHSGKGDEKNAALVLEGRCELKASDLGLKALPPGAPITIRFGLTAYPESAAASSGKKK